jgi:hypothetical protein
LKKNYQTFSTTNYTLDGAGKGKRLILDGNTMDAVIVGNFDVIGINMIPGFTHTGTWYDYMTGSAIEVSSTSTPFSFMAGEYHIYTDQPLPVPDLITCATYGQPCDDGNPATIDDVYNEVCECAGTVGIKELENQPYLIYPNPTSENWHIQWETPNTEIQFEVRTAQGQLIWKSQNQETMIPSAEWAPGLYILSVVQNGEQRFVTPLMKN